ncbi:MAG TPA: DivIVA domain-containing protein, partial [Acidimicrobiales bacterium]|nr:DivIVA domain-containing protein [Acidimicrobiales bacterium]
MSPEPPLDATGIARRQFSTVRRGYDPTEVRAFLNELSEVVGRLQREEAHEHERAERAENRAELAEKLDEHRLVELLGEETARVLEAAREAAGDIRTKAEESAARMVREAQAQARSVTEHAERDASARRAEIMGEVEDLRREATDELDRRRVEGQILIDDMRRVAESERDQMIADGERSRAEAAAAAEQIRAAARDQGRRLVGEAQAVRERILGDLARRRRTAREQLERLNGARERLLAAYEVVRRTVDEATTELTVALPQARVASAAAVQRVRDEPDESVDVLEAELSVARMSGAIDEGSATVSDDELDAMLRELAEEEAAQAAARREAEAGMALGEADLPDDLDEPAAEGEAPDTTGRRGGDDTGTSGAASADAARPGSGAAPDADDTATR